MSASTRGLAASELLLPSLTVNTKTLMSIKCIIYICSDGIVHALDVSEEFTSIGKPFWKEAGVEHKIKLTIAPAAETLTKLVEAGEENTFDFAFIDADKVS